MTKADPHRYAGLFDLEDYSDFISTLSRAVELPVEEVQERVFYESFRNGWNINQCVEEYGVTPHHYDVQMEAFYKCTDAFVFELAVNHRERATVKVDHLVIGAVSKYVGEPMGQTILILGDGIGSDALRFAHLGYGTSYFDSPSARLARLRFERSNCRSAISTIYQLEDIPQNHFDALICREVLEHVVNPEEVIGNIWNYLKPGGKAFITESFHRIEPAFPTHLESNLKFAGQTPNLFVEAGFEYLGLFNNKKPFVFSKTSLRDNKRFVSLRRKRLVRKWLTNETRKLFRRIPF